MPDPKIAADVIKKLDEQLAALEREALAVRRMRNDYAREFGLPLLPEEGFLNPFGRVAVGSISVRKAALDILREAEGKVMLAKEIWLEAKRRGAVSSSKDPVSQLDRTLENAIAQGQPIEKLPKQPGQPKRQWRWIGEGAKRLEAVQ